jgi:hypothetical protein
LFFVSGFVFSQSIENSYRVKISDNRNNQFTTFEYLFKNDSLKIFGSADYGNRMVEYLSLKLKSKQVKQLKEYLQTFHADSLQENYFDDFVSFGYITADHFPRVIELEVRLGNFTGKDHRKTKITNCYVKHVGDLFDFLNKYIPKEEVKLKFKKDDFKKEF